MNPMIEEQLIYFYDSGYDRSHPNTNGQERMAHTLMYQLLSLPASFWQLDIHFFVFLEEFVYLGEPPMFRYELEELKKCSNGKLMLFEHFFISSYLLKE